MFWQNLKTIHHACGELLAMDKSKIDDMVANGHALLTTLQHHLMISKKYITLRQILKMYEGGEN
jgi:hypothetical protein